MKKKNTKVRGRKNVDRVGGQVEPLVSPQLFVKNLCNSLNLHMTRQQPLESYIDACGRIVIRGEHAEIALAQDGTISGARGYCRVVDVM